MLCKPAFWIPHEPKAFAGNLDNSFGEHGFGRGSLRERRSAGAGIGAVWALIAFRTFRTFTPLMAFWPFAPFMPGWPAKFRTFPALVPFKTASGNGTLRDREIWANRSRQFLRGTPCKLIRPPRVELLQSGGDSLFAGLFLPRFSNGTAGGLRRSGLCRRLCPFPSVLFVSSRYGRSFDGRHWRSRANRRRWGHRANSRNHWARCRLVGALSGSGSPFLHLAALKNGLHRLWTRASPRSRRRTLTCRDLGRAGWLRFFGRRRGLNTLLNPYRFRCLNGSCDRRFHRRFGWRRHRCFDRCFVRHLLCLALYTPRRALLGSGFARCFDWRRNGCLDGRLGRGYGNFIGHDLLEFGHARTVLRSRFFCGSGCLFGSRCFSLKFRFAEQRRSIDRFCHKSECKVLLARFSRRGVRVCYRAPVRGGSAAAHQPTPSSVRSRIRPGAWLSNPPEYQSWRERFGRPRRLPARHRAGLPGRRWILQPPPLCFLG